MRPIREKDVLRFQEKIEDAVNCLSLENCIDMPDFIIAECLANYFKQMCDTAYKNEVWHGRQIPVKQIGETE